MKTRILIAIVLILIVAPFLYLGGIPFALGVSILGILSYKEVLNLNKYYKEIPNVIKIVGLISLCYLMVGNYDNSILSFIDYKLVILPLLLMLLPTVFSDKYSIKDSFILLSFIYLIGIGFNLVITIRDINMYLLVYLISICVCTDTFAYFIGTFLGRHKMSAKISPKKTWEGFAGGLIFGTIIPLIIYNFLVSNISFKIVIVSIVLSVVDQIGDLVFSKIKRENNIKDFSNLMPGHGGILDRLDSFIFVVIAFVFIITL